MPTYGLTITASQVQAQLDAGAQFVAVGTLRFKAGDSIPADDVLAVAQRTIAITYGESGDPVPPAVMPAVTAAPLASGPTLEQFVALQQQVNDMAFDKSQQTAAIPAAQYLTAAGMTAPSAGVSELDVEYVPAANLTDTVVARQAGLIAVVVSNGAASTYTVTLSPPAGGTFQNGTITSYVLNPGSSVTLKQDPHSATGWIIA